MIYTLKEITFILKYACAELWSKNLMGRDNLEDQDANRNDIKKYLEEI
jgi:hypothetical protein